VFLSYSQQDKKWKDRLLVQLDVLRRQGLLDIWHDRQIAPGEDWSPLIDRALATADVAILRRRHHPPEMRELALESPIKLRMSNCTDVPTTAAPRYRPKPWDF
jgi:hypothetical protein